MKGHAEKIQILIHYVICMNRFSFVISQKEAQGRKEVQDTFFSRCISPRGLKAAKTMCSRQCPTTFLYVMQVHAIMPYTHLIEKFSDFFSIKGQHHPWPILKMEDLKELAHDVARRNGEIIID